MFGMDKDTLGKEKHIAVMGACSICLLILILFAGGEEGEISAGEVSVPEAPAADCQVKTSTRILGADQAAHLEKLADPFSPAHLTREEMEQAGIETELQIQERAEARLERQKAQNISVAEESRQEGSFLPESESVLQGIIHGEHGAIAIFRQGENSISLCVGEKLGEMTLTEIRRGEVLFDHGERMILEVPQIKVKSNREELK